MYLHKYTHACIGVFVAILQHNVEQCCIVENHYLKTASAGLLFCHSKFFLQNFFSPRSAERKELC